MTTLSTTSATVPSVHAVLDRVILTHEGDQFTVRHLVRTAAATLIGLLFVAAACYILG